MTSPFTAWQLRHGVSAQAVAELAVLLGLVPDLELPEAKPGTEADVQARCRAAASRRHDLYLWRNNVGVLNDERGVPVRYGLANDSKKINDRIKSSDLIGGQSVVVTPAMVGQRLLVFTSLEVKRPGWVYAGTDREMAQLAWINLINSLGGQARFVTDPSQLPPAQR